MSKKDRPNLVTGLVSNSASIIEAAQQVEREVKGASSPLLNPQEKENEVIEQKSIEVEPNESQMIEIDNEELSFEPSVISSSFDISIFFQEINSKDVNFKTTLMCQKHINLIRNLSTVFEVPIQAITYNIVDHWYKTYKPWIDKERKRRIKDIF